MNYYYLDGICVANEGELNELNGYGRAISISYEQYMFGITYPHASLEEVLAMELNPIPEQPTQNIITYEERLLAVENLMKEMLLW